MVKHLNAAFAQEVATPHRDANQAVARVVDGMQNSFSEANALFALIALKIDRLAAEGSRGVPAVVSPAAKGPVAVPSIAHDGGEDAMVEAQEGANCASFFIARFDRAE